MTVTPINDEVAVDTPPQLRIPSFEGMDVDKCTLTFSGSVEITDQKLIDAIKLNKSIELVVSGKFKARAHNVKDDADGYLKETISRSTVKIDDVALVSDDES